MKFRHFSQNYLLRSLRELKARLCSWRNQQKYKSLHPEDKTATENELTDITIKNILTDGIYNDLGFLFREKFMILSVPIKTYTKARK